jgi:hypothetical protein
MAKYDREAVASALVPVESVADAGLGEILR